MSTTTITIEVATEAAKAFVEAAPEEQRKLQLEMYPIVKTKIGLA